MKALTASVVLILALIVPSFAYAQPIIYPEDGLNTQDGVFDSQGREVPTLTSGEQGGTRFDWKWIIPIALLPLLYWAFKRGSEGSAYQDRYDYPLVGVRGGEVISNGDEEDEFGWHDDIEREHIVKKLPKTP